MHNPVTKEELKTLLTQDEDGYLERKTSGQRSQITDALVAFANSMPPGREGVVFIGQQQDKKIIGVDNPDELQKSVKNWASQCYPPVEVHPEILTTDQGQVLALVIPFSPKKPHFAGKAYKRVGSQTLEASEEMLDEMIASRNEKAGRLLAHKGEPVVVDFEYRPFGGLTATWIGEGQQRASILTHSEQCLIESASAHSVEIRRVASGRLESFPLERIVITKDVQYHHPIRVRVKLEE